MSIVWLKCLWQVSIFTKDNIFTNDSLIQAKYHVLDTNIKSLSVGDAIITLHACNTNQPQIAIVGVYLEAKSEFLHDTCWFITTFAFHECLSLGVWGCMWVLHYLAAFYIWIGQCKMKVTKTIAKQTRKGHIAGWEVKQINYQPFIHSWIIFGSKLTTLMKKHTVDIIYQTPLHWQNNNT